MNNERTMTNEELVAKIQQGERDLLLQLWEQVERFVSKLANKWARALDGVEFDDLYQSGYLAMVAAVETFDPAQGMAFIGWLAFYLKTAFLEAAGRRTERQLNDPLHGATSLDQPADEKGLTTIGDLQVDPDSLRAFEEAENRLWRAELRAVLDKAMDALPEVERDTVRRRFFQGQTLEAIASVEGVSKTCIQQREYKGLRNLRRPKISRELRAFIEEQTPYYKAVGVGQFQRTHSSAVEELVLMRERMREGDLDRSAQH